MRTRNESGKMLSLPSWGESRLGMISRIELGAGDVEFAGTDMSPEVTENLSSL